MKSTLTAALLAFTVLLGFSSNVIACNFEDGASCQSANEKQAMRIRPLALIPHVSGRIEHDKRMDLSARIPRESIVFSTTESVEKMAEWCKQQAEMRGFAGDPDPFRRADAFLTRVQSFCHNKSGELHIFVERSNEPEARTFVGMYFY